MKTNILRVLAPAALLALLLPATVLNAGLTVHEWGTFTVLLGSDGQAVRWYQPQQDLAGLPAFVEHPYSLMKSRGGIPGASFSGVLARMETPVLYFYPGAAMNVSVTASLVSGSLTEWYPNALATQAAPDASQGLSLQWIGRLLPPSSPEARHIPHTADAAGRRYDAARAVPDAWLFESSLPAPAASGEAARPQIDNLIFYRGAGELLPPLSAFSEDDASYSLRNTESEPVPAVFAVRAAGGRLAWHRSGPLPPAQPGKAPAPTTITFEPGKEEDPSVALPALRQAMAEALAAQGLTPKEAAAMVQTWGDLWFTETGTRMLALLPQPCVISSVRLNIVPAPEKVARVYVARLEMLTKERENRLLTVLSEKTEDIVAARRLKSLEFGRFTQGALQRVKEIKDREMDKRLYQLTTAQ